MQHKKIILDIDFTQTVQELTQVYQEAAVMQMQKIRDKVLKSRSFAEELAVLFGEVSASYKENLFQKLKKNKKILPLRQKELAILVAPEGKLSGDILAQVFQKFKAEMQNFRGNIVIIGKLGKQMAEQHGFTKKFAFFEFPTSQTDASYVQLINSIAQYDSITLYHGQFINLLQQEPQSSQIKGEQVVAKNIQKTDVVTHYLYEPSMTGVMDYFEKQIFAAVFQQRLQESQLSQLGARIKAMETASNNISDRLQILYKHKRLNAQLHENKKQLERLSGVALTEGII